jgi:hypothetical protein
LINIPVEFMIFKEYISWFYRRRFFLC